MQRGPTSGNKSSNKSRQQIVNINLGDHVVRTVNTKTTTTAKTTSKKRVSTPGKKKVSESTRPTKRRKAKTDDKPSISAKQKALADEMKSLSKQWHDAISVADPNFVTSEMSTIPNDLLSPDSISDMERLNDWLRKDIVKLNALPRKGAKSAAFNIPTNPAFANQFGQQLSLENIRAAEDRADKLAKAQQEETSKVLQYQKDVDRQEKIIKEYERRLKIRKANIRKAEADLKTQMTSEKWNSLHKNLIEEELSGEKRKLRVQRVINALKKLKELTAKAKAEKLSSSVVENWKKLYISLSTLRKEVDEDRKEAQALNDSIKSSDSVTTSPIDLKSLQKSGAEIKQMALQLESNIEPEDSPEPSIKTMNPLYTTPSAAQPTDKLAMQETGQKGAPTSDTDWSDFFNSLTTILDSEYYQGLKEGFKESDVATKIRLKSWGNTQAENFKELWLMLGEFKRKVVSELRTQGKMTDNENTNAAEFDKFMEVMDKKQENENYDGFTPSMFYQNLYDFFTVREVDNLDNQTLVLIVTKDDGSLNDGRLGRLAEEDRQPGAGARFGNTIVFSPYDFDLNAIDARKTSEIRVSKNTPFTPIKETKRSNYMINYPLMFPNTLPSLENIQVSRQMYISQRGEQQPEDNPIFDEEDPSPEEGSNPPTRQPDFDQSYIDPGSADLGADLTGQSGTEVSVDPAVLQLNEQAIAAIERKYPPENTNEFMDKVVAQLLNYLRAKKTTKTIMNSIGLTNVAAAVAYFAAAQKYLFSEEDFISSEKLDSLANTPQSIRLVKFGDGGPFGLTYYLYVLGKAVTRREGGNNLSQRAIFTKDGIPYEMARTNQINP